VKPCDPRSSPDEFLKIMAETPNAGHRYFKPCVRVDLLLTFAYDVPRSRLRGLPPWAPQTFFEVDARAGTPVGIDHMRRLVQQLLVERFALRSRTEVVVVDQFALMRTHLDGALGSSAKPAAIDCSPEAFAERELAGPPPDEHDRSRCRRTGVVRGEEVINIYNGVTMQRFAEMLPVGGEIVVDKTGIQGVYDITLSTRGVDAEESGPAPRSFAPLVRALREQLGLRLERSRGEGRVVIVERLELPTEN
jgi:uncharacterized protein (TIGR03435 family)